MNALSFSEPLFIAEPLAVCRSCGCTEDDRCYRHDFGRCWWAEVDLCSHCAPAVRAERQARRWRLACLAVVAIWATLVALTLILGLSTPQLRPAIGGEPASSATRTPMHQVVRGAPWPALT